jgi:hypothetical protein
MFWDIDSRKTQGRRFAWLHRAMFPRGTQARHGRHDSDIEGERVTSEVVLHFKDGSVHNETTVFSQDREFRLISEHLRQYAGQAVAKVDVCTVVTSFSENSIFCHVQTDMTGQFDLHPLPLKTLGIFARKMVDGYPHSIPRREPRRSSSQRRIRSLAWWSTLGATKVF